MKCRRLVIHVALPLLFGIAIYLLWRSSSLRVFHWLSAIGLLDPVMFLRTLAQPVAVSIPAWCLYSLPDGLWAYSLSSAVLITWRSHSSRWGILWFTFAATLGIASELGQYLGLVPGTFETADLLCYALGSMSPLIMLGRGHSDEAPSYSFGHDIGRFRTLGNRQY